MSGRSVVELGGSKTPGKGKSYDVTSRPPSVNVSAFRQPVLHNSPNSNHGVSPMPYPAHLQQRYPMPYTPPETPRDKTLARNASQSSNTVSLSRRSSQSSIKTISSFVSTAQSIQSSRTSASRQSLFEAKYERQSMEWNESSVVARIQHSQTHYKITPVPHHVVGKRATFLAQLKRVEQLIQSTPNINFTETGGYGWCLMSEKHALKHAINYDDRAHAEWDAANDWNISAHSAPVSKLFVSQPSRFGLTPEQHKYKMDQYKRLSNNALDLWRFSDLNYQDAYRIRTAREKLVSADRASDPVHVEAGAAKPCTEKKQRQDFQSWLKEVSKNSDATSVRDDGSIFTTSVLNMKL